MRLHLICSIVLCLPLAFFAPPTQAQTRAHVKGDIRVGVRIHISQANMAARAA